MELLADLNERDGTAIVAVLHDLGLASLFFPRLVVIDGGRIVADGPPAEVLTDERIRDVFGVDPAIVRRVAPSAATAATSAEGRVRSPTGPARTRPRPPRPDPPSSADAHRRLRPRAVLRPLGVRRPPPALRLGRRGLADGRPARPRRRRDRALWADLRLGYTEAPGHPLLRAEIATLYETIEPDDVLVFAGAEEAIFCLSNVLLGPGDHAVVTWPGYQSLYEVGRAAGADVTLHELHEADGWALDPARLIATPPAEHPARRRQRPAQPDRHAPDRTPSGRA